MFSKLFRLLTVMIILIGISACNENNNRPKNNPPPPPPDNRCSTLKANTYQSLKDGDIEILFNDTFSGDDWSQKRYYMDSVLEHHFHLSHLPIFNSDFVNCVQPIMDSALAAKYGANAKDSIINEAYRLTEIIYKKENK